MGKTYLEIVVDNDEINKERDDYFYGNPDNYHEIFSGFMPLEHIKLIVNDIKEQEGISVGYFEFYPYRKTEVLIAEIDGVNTICYTVWLDNPPMPLYY